MSTAIMSTKFSSHNNVDFRVKVDPRGWVRGRGLGVVLLLFLTIYDVWCQFHKHFTCKFFLRMSFWQLFLRTCN